MAVLRRPRDEALHRLQISAKLFIPFSGEALEIDVHGVHIRQKLLQNRKFRAAIGDKHIFHAPLPYQPGRIPDKFIPNQRLVIGESHADIPTVLILLRQSGKRFRRSLLPVRLSAVRHGNLIILAKGTGQVTAEAPHGKNPASGEKTAQRLLFYRIKHQGCEFSVIDADDFSLSVFSGPAAPGLPLRQ